MKTQRLTTNLYRFDYTFGDGEWYTVAKFATSRRSAVQWFRHNYKAKQFVCRIGIN